MKLKFVVKSRHVFQIVDS